MATNWWEEYETVAPANDPGFTGYIPGKPKEDKPPSGYVRAPDGSLTPEKGGPADPYRPGGELDPNKPEKEGEAKSAQALAASFYSRALASHRAYDQGIEPRDPASQTVVDALPQNWTNPWTAPKRRAAQNYVEEFIRAKLRKESGAAIPDPEMAREYPVYFPVPGDTKDDLERKRLLREQVIEGLRVSAGSAADKVKIIDLPKLSDYDATPSGTEKPGVLDQPLTAPAAAATGGESSRDSLGVSELTADQKRAYEGFWAANPNPSPQQLSSFLAGIGIERVGNAAEIIQAVKEGRGFSAQAIDTDYRTKLEQRLKQQEEIGVGGESAAETLAKQGATLNLSDEAGGVGNAISNIVTAPFTGDFDPIAAYRFGRDLERLRIADARRQLGYGGTAIELAGGLAAAGPSGALAALAPREAAIQAGRAGAVGGALAGFGAGEGASESLVGAGGGAGVGYGLGRYGPSALEWAMPRRFRQSQGRDPRLGAAAEAESVRISQPMIEGNRRAVNKAGRLEADSASAEVIQRGFADTAEDIEVGVARLGQGGEAQERGPMGETFRQAARDIQRADREGATIAYDAARAAQPNAVVDPMDMRTKIAAKIAQLERRPNQNAQQIRELKRYQADLEKPLPLEEIRAIRTDARDNISGLNIARSSGAKKADRFMMELIDSANTDIERALAPEALKAWKAADAQYRENQTLYRQALKPIFGDDFDKLSGEQIFDRVKATANGNGRALAGFHRRLTTEQSRDFAATIAEQLGRRSADEPFSAMLFMQQARKFSPSARKTIFGPSGAASFDNLLLLSRRLQRAQSEINRSKTARPVMDTIRKQAGNFLTVMLGGGGFVAGGPIGGAGGVAAGLTAKAAGEAIGGIRRAVSARALMNPRVTRWMADAADVSSEREAKELTQRLGGIIAREPMVANDLQPFYEFLTQRLSQPLAAEPQAEGEDDER